MTTKTKKITLLTAGIAGTLLASSVAAVTLSACTFQVVNPNLGASSNNGSTLEKNPQYNVEIDWTDNTPADEWTLGDPLPVSRLVIDEQGLVYANNAKTELIATVPNFSRPEIVIPASVQRITGYKKVVKNPNAAPIKTGLGAFQEVTTLRSVKFAGNNIKSIGVQAFAGAANLETVQLPSSVTVIRSNAFFNCPNLTNINLDNVQVIENEAFKGSFATTNSINSSISIKSAISIGNNAFENVANLQAINFTNSPNLIRIGNNAFKGATLGKTFDLSQAKNLVSLGNSVFENTTGVDTIKLPNNLKTLGNVVFKNSSIKSIDVSNTKITVIPDNTFFGCANLESVNLGDNITSLGNTSFSGTSKLTTLRLPNSLVTLNAAFKDAQTNGNPNNLSGITEIDLSNTQITSIPAGAFDGANKLQKVTLNNKITTIAGTAFRQNNALATMGPAGTPEGTLKLPASVTTLSGQAIFQGTAFSTADLSETKITALNQQYTFASANNIKSMKFPSTLTSIGDSNNNILPPSLSLVDLSNTKVTTIGNNLFNGNKNISNISLPNTVTTIGEGAFANSSITNIDLPTALTSLGNSVFENTKITSLALPEGLTTIGNKAFMNTDLAAITVKSSSSRSTTKTNGLAATLPSSVTTIGTQAFQNTKLSGIDLSSTKVTVIQNYAFANNKNLTSVYLPTGITNIGARAFGLQGTTLPEGQTSATPLLTTIGTLADLGVTSGSARDAKAQAILPSTVANVADNIFQFSGVTSVDASKITSFRTGIKTGNTPYSDIEKKQIPGWFFADLPNLTAAVLPNWVAGVIPTKAFFNTPKLQSVTVGAFPTATYAGEDDATTTAGTFDISGSNISGFDTSVGSQFQNSNLGTFKFPAKFNRTSIPANAFAGSKLSSVTETTKATGENNIIDATTTTIGQGAFSNTAITTLDLSKATGLTTIQANTFQNNKNLTTLDLSKNTALTTIGVSAFQGNEKLAEVKWPTTVTRTTPSLTTISTNAFSETALTEVDLSNITSLTTIQPNAFSNNEKLATVKLPSSLQTSAANAFQNISKTASISYPNGISVTGASVSGFANDTTLKELDLSSSANLTTLAANAFANSTNLGKLTLPAKAVQWQLAAGNASGNPLFNNSKTLNIEFTAFAKSASDTSAPSSFAEVNTDYVKQQIANIMNMFSRYVGTAGIHPTQYSNWTAGAAGDTTGANYWINQDLTKDDVFSGWLKDSTNSNLEENKSGATKNHNGVTWKYEKDSTGNITIISQVDSSPINMYRTITSNQWDGSDATNGGKFQSNQGKQTYFSTPVDNSNGAPAQDIKVTVTMKIVKVSA